MKDVLYYLLFTIFIYNMNYIFVMLYLLILKEDGLKDHKHKNIIYPKFMNFMIFMIFMIFGTSPP